MDVPELEAEVSRLREELERRKDKEAAIAERIVEVNEHHRRLSGDLDGYMEEVRAMKKSLRWLLAKARGEEESL